MSSAWILLLGEPIWRHWALISHLEDTVLPLTQIGPYEGVHIYVSLAQFLTCQQFQKWDSPLPSPVQLNVLWKITLLYFGDESETGSPVVLLRRLKVTQGKELSDEQFFTQLWVTRRVCLPLSFVFPQHDQRQPSPVLEKKEDFLILFSREVSPLLIKNKHLVLWKGTPVFCFVLFCFSK